MRKGELISPVEVVSIGHKGKTIGKMDGQVIILENAVPGDVVAARLKRKRKGLWYAFTEEVLSGSSYRQEPVCTHFDDCGGCSWQHFQYEGQLQQKEQIVKDAIQRIAKVPVGEFLPILKAEKIYHYRNKLEYSCSAKKWVPKSAADSDEPMAKDFAIGLHPPKFFDKVVDIERCHLMDSKGDEIRNFIRDYALKNELTPYNPTSHTGFLRSMILRNTLLGDWMVILVFAYEQPEIIKNFLSVIKAGFPFINSLYYVINPKKNDSIYDLDPVFFAGETFITEVFDHVRYKIGPKSFFQTNSYQAKRLYQLIAERANIRSSDLVYDLYSGLGSIALFVANRCKKVIGIEEVSEAVRFAKENAEFNQIENTSFFVGDVKQILNSTLHDQYGNPDVVITDPPRVGMHEAVIAELLNLSPRTIIYVSCNPSTQARDIALLDAQYQVDSIQAVDMFPQTNHVESLAVLSRK